MIRQISYVLHQLHTPAVLQIGHEIFQQGFSTLYSLRKKINLDGAGLSFEDLLSTSKNCHQIMICWTRAITLKLESIWAALKAETESWIHKFSSIKAGRMTHQHESFTSTI